MRERMRADRQRTTTGDIEPPGRVRRAGSAPNSALVGLVQPRLTVGAADDRYEQEAERVARAVVAGSGATNAAVGGAGSDRMTMDDDAIGLRRIDLAGIGAAGGDLDSDTERAITSTSGGDPLSAPVQRDMEGAFGADFSAVRVHTGPKVDSLNSTLNAQAFTSHSDIYMRSGDYQPASREGRHLLAHELTHVVQQGAAPLQPSAEADPEPA